jgi:hypothetical protein
LDEVAALGGLMELDRSMLLLLGELLESGDLLALDGWLLLDKSLELGESSTIEGSLRLDEALKMNESLALDEPPELCESLELEVLEVIFVLSVGEIGQRSLSLGVLVGLDVGCLDG